MCLAIPARIVEMLDGDACRVELGGVRKEISLALVDGAAVGDYVIVHVGYALTRLDPDEAARTLALFAEVAAAADVPPPAGAAHPPAPGERGRGDGAHADSLAAADAAAPAQRCGDPVP